MPRAGYTQRTRIRTPDTYTLFDGVAEQMQADDANTDSGNERQQGARQDGFLREVPSLPSCRWGPNRGERIPLNTFGDPRESTPLHRPLLLGNY